MTSKKKFRVRLRIQKDVEMTITAKNKSRAIRDAKEKLMDKHSLKSNNFDAKMTDVIAEEGDPK
jgi:hypothetical protein